MPDTTSAAERVHRLSGTSTVPAALEEIRRGRPVVVLDDADRENEGDLIFAAELATAELLSFVVRHTSGFVCVALPPADCDRLQLDPMPVDNRDRFGTAYRVTVDLTGTGTGISAAARARTITALASPEHRAADFIRPGHVVPLQARDGGVLQRPGHTEAAVDLARLAGLRPAGGLCEIVSTRDPAAMASGEELYDFAAEHGLATVTIADLITYRLETERLVDRGPDIALPTRHGIFRGIGYRDTTTRDEHIALLAAGTDLTQDTPVHVHHECLASDVFGGRSCRCSHHLDAALDAIGRADHGLIVYLRSRGPRGCPHFHTPATTMRTAHVAAAVVEDLGVQRAALVHADPLHRLALESALHPRGVAITELAAVNWSHRSSA